MGNNAKDCGERARVNWHWRCEQKIFINCSFKNKIKILWIKKINPTNIFLDSYGVFLSVVQKKMSTYPKGQSVFLSCTVLVENKLKQKKLKKSSPLASEHANQFHSYLVVMQHKCLRLTDCLRDMLLTPG